MVITDHLHQVHAARPFQPTPPIPTNPGSCGMPIPTNPGSCGTPRPNHPGSCGTPRRSHPGSCRPRQYGVIGTDYTSHIARLGATRGRTDPGEVPSTGATPRPEPQSAIHTPRRSRNPQSARGRTGCRSHNPHSARDRTPDQSRNPQSARGRTGCRGHNPHSARDRTPDRSRNPQSAIRNPHSARSCNKQSLS